MEGERKGKKGEERERKGKKGKGKRERKGKGRERGKGSESESEAENNNIHGKRDSYLNQIRSNVELSLMTTCSWLLTYFLTGWG